MQPVWLEMFVERIRSKTFLAMLTRGWDRSVGIVIEDCKTEYFLQFNGDEVDCVHDIGQHPVDMLLQGTERDLQMLFTGDSLIYLHAKKSVTTRGTFRDQLKLESLIRLAAKPSACDQSLMYAPVSVNEQKG